jgi:DNA-binding NtrC family response regulator
VKTILAVDDETAILRCFERALKSQGYDVLVTSDPMRVSKLLQNHDLDLLMLDVRMPRKSGLQLFEELKQKFRNLPVLFVTAYPKSFSMDTQATMEMWQRDFADGNTDILYKPVDLDTLYEKVAGLIGPPEEDAQE